MVVSPKTPRSEMGRPAASAPVTPTRLAAVLARPEACIACGVCADTCPRSAISLEETAVIDPQRCNGCGMCVNECPYGALSLAGA